MSLFAVHSYRDFSDNDLRGIGYSLLHCKGYDEKFHGVACLGKTVKSYTVEELRKLERLSCLSCVYFKP